MRRFELPIGPLLARLGYTRPDEDPLQSAREIFPSYGVGNFALSVASPGENTQVLDVAVPAVVGNFSYAYVTPPPDGCWLRLIFSGSAVVWASENSTAFPALGASGGFATTIRFDNREALNPLATQTGSNVAGTFSTTLETFGGYLSLTPPIWWYGTRLGFQSLNANEAIVIQLIVTPPVVGMRRQIT